MTERERMPMAERMHLSVPTIGMEPDRLRMFATCGVQLAFLDTPQEMEVHPDFAARAAIWRDQRSGLISLAEAQRRSAAIGTPQVAPRKGVIVRTSAPARPRHSRPEPTQSRQYAPEMATTAARDDRLTPNAKALLAVLRARCGKGRETPITKGTMAAVMSRSTRTIRRYLSDLCRFGYITLEIRTTGRGLHIGLVARITEKVLPFFAEPTGLARWLAETPAALDRTLGPSLPRYQGVTKPTPKNQSQNSLSTIRSRLLGMGRMGRIPAPT